MPVIETLILIGGLVLFSGVAIFDQHSQLEEAKKNCPPAAVQNIEKK